MLRPSAATDRYALRCPGTMLSSLAFLALLASVQGRAVNISNTWVLPEEGFPVFYRYFRDRISWYEADAVCQFHHANLVTVDTTAQYDAVRAYLKELDISSAVWVGLIRSNPDGDFTWTDYRGLGGDGYWSSAPDTRSAPLCAAADPAADYRWEARACGGPTVASFICELPVPQWALGNEGCMVRELPALTILYLPESAAVQLNADCGLAGVKRVECTGNVKREGLLKDLSCADEEEMSSTSTQTSSGTNWPAITNLTTDLETTSEVTTEENLTTEHEDKEHIVITATLLPHYITSKSQYKSPTKYTDMNNFNTVTFRKNINLEGANGKNVESNLIPKMIDEGNMLTNEQLEKLEDERHMQHKMLHEEIARVGNVDNIFTQPTDHFIPPLVMAKSRMSDDMTVLSLAEKHAQQLAEKQFSKHIQNNHRHESNNDEMSSDYTHKDKTLITPIKPNKINDIKKDNLKTHVPKKYINEKYYDVKGKVAKPWESKTTVQDTLMESTQTTTMLQEDSKAITVKDHPQFFDKIDEDFAMDLKVMLKDASFTSAEQTANSFRKDENNHDKIETTTQKPILTTLKVDYDTESLESSSPVSVKTTDNSTIEHQVIQITVLSDDDPAINTTTFEITTKMPIFRDDIDKPSTYSTSLSTEASIETEHIDNIMVTSENTSKANNTVSLVSGKFSTASDTFSIATTTENTILINATTIHSIEVNAAEFVSTTIPIFENKTEQTEIPTTMSTTTFSNITDIIDKITAETNSSVDSLNISTGNITIEKLHFNNTEIHDLLEKNITDTEEIIDENSPLLSGAYEPIQRPPRTRRPQEPNRKFNPFRILG